MNCARKILVVDDEPQILNMLGDAFGRNGYSVYLASNADEAFGILKQESIPLMFIDLGLESMNGFELCKNIRKDNPDALIYALTGYAAFYDPQEFVGAGFDDYFDKPISLEDLYRTAKESFEKLDSNS
jgi:DNA-binding response OmpR family regulator